MKSLIALSTVIVLSLSIMSLSQDRLSRSEVLDIVDQLIQEQRTAWIQTGTLDVLHWEYRAPRLTDPAEIEAEVQQAIADFPNNPLAQARAEEWRQETFEALPFNTRWELANESTMTTQEVLTVDHEMFHLDITVLSRTDSIQPPASLASNRMKQHFNLSGNRRRTMAWDGQDFTRYYRSQNNAIVDGIGMMSADLRDPLTTGLIPWGAGFFSLENLRNTDISGSVDSKNSTLSLTFVLDGEIQFDVTLDTQKDYMPILHSISRPGLVTTTRLSDYQKKSGIWIAQEIERERYSHFQQRTTRHDTWIINPVSTKKPKPTKFKVQYEDNAFIQHFTPLSKRPVRYHHNSLVDTGDLLSRRLDVLSSKGQTPNNCATLSLSYVAERLGRQISPNRLKNLVDPAGKTSMLSLQQAALSHGLYCQGIKTTIEGLRQIDGYQVILHFPEKEHFVVLAGIDQNKVWCVDLASNRVYYPTDVAVFDMDWTKGTALVISDQPIVLGKAQQALTDNEMMGAIGGAGYSCSKMLQYGYTIYCQQPDEFGECWGNTAIIFDVWGCEEAPSGSCSEDQSFLLFETAPCDLKFGTNKCEIVSSQITSESVSGCDGDRPL